MYRIIGTISVALAGLLYVVPLQILLFDLARKREDGSGALAWIIVFGGIWLLLMVGLWCVTAEGGFDRLRIDRRWQYVLAALVALCFAVLTLLRLEFPKHQGVATRIIIAVVVHAIPLLTMLLVLVNVQPRFALWIPHKAVFLPWILCAASGLVACGGYLGYQLVGVAGNKLGGLTHTLQQNNALNAENLALIPQLDPKRDFAELIRFTHEFNSDAVRAAAITRLRQDTGFVTSLVAELDSGSAEKALATVEVAALTPEEQKVVALPARTAIERYTQDTRSDFRYIPKDRRKLMRSSMERLFNGVAQALPASDVDLRPAIAAFDRVFEDPEPE